MLRAPKFWYKNENSFFSLILYPASLLFRITTTLYAVINKSKSSSVPVICIGNLVVGGAGKTPMAIKVGKLLKLAGYNPNFLSRGYAGNIKDNIKVTNNHLAKDVGDEAMILSSIAPTWIGSDRIKSSFLAT